MQNMCFSRLNQVACKSPGQAAKHLRDKILKICLSIFRDWKFYPRGSRERSHENFCLTLATRASTCEQVASMSRKKLKNLDFEKFSKFFATGTLTRQWVTKTFWASSQLGHVTGLTHDQVAKTGQQSFWNFWYFCQKQKTFQKQNETLKNLLMFDQQKLSMWKHI